MILAFLADLHARGKDLDAFRRQLKAAVDRIIAEKADAVVIGGDVFDSASIGDGYASDGAILEAVISQLVRLSQAGIPVHVIGGDHDQAGAGQASAILGLKGIPGVEVYVEPRVVMIDDVILLALPWNWSPTAAPVDDIERLIEEAAAEFPEPSAIVLAMHITIAGLLMTDKRVAEPVGDNNARARRWVVSRDYLDSLIAEKRVHFIRSGDIHRRGDYNLGALRQLNHGEEGNPAGFEMLDTATGEVRWFELDEAPRYRTVEVDAGMMTPEAPASNEILKVRLECELDPGEVRRLESLGVTVERIVERDERRARAEVPANIANDDDALIRMFAASLEPPVEGEQLARHLEVFHEVFADQVESKPEAASAQATGTDDVDPF